MTNTIDRRKALTQAFKTQKKGSGEKKPAQSSAKTEAPVWADGTMGQAHGQAHTPSPHAMPEPPAATQPSSHETLQAAAHVPSMPPTTARAQSNVVVPQEMLVRFLALTGQDKSLTADRSGANWRNMAKVLFLSGEASAGAVHSYLTQASMNLKFDFAESAAIAQNLANLIWSNPAQLGNEAEKSLRHFKTQDHELGQNLSHAADAIGMATQAIEKSVSKSGHQLDQLTEAMRDAIQVAGASLYYTQVAQHIIDDPSTKLGMKASSLTQFMAAIIQSAPAGAKDPSVPVLYQAITRLNRAQASNKILQEAAANPRALAQTNAERSNPYARIQQRAELILNMQVALRLADGKDKQTIFAVLKQPNGDAAALKNVARGNVLISYLQALTPADKTTLAQNLGSPQTMAEALDKLSTLQPPAEQKSAGKLKQSNVAAFSAIQNAAPQANIKALRDARQILVQGNDRAALVDKLENLLSRLEPPLTARNDNLSRRAFETKLIENLAHNTPPSTLKAWDHFSDTFVTYIKQNVTAEADLAFLAQKMVARKQHAGVRPWSKHAPERVITQPIFSSLETIMQSPSKTGFDVMAKAQHVRDLWNALDDLDDKRDKTRAGAAEVTPRRATTHAFYRDVIRQATGRIEHLASQTPSNPRKNIDPKTNALAGKAQEIGIMANHQPAISPTAGEVYTLPGRRHNIALLNENLRKRVAAGAVTASGISGSMNILVNLYDNFHSPAFAQAVPKEDLLLGATQFLVYDGGHSVDEVMWTMQNAVGAKHQFPANNDTPMSYAHFSNIFENSPQVSEAIDKALTQMEGYWLANVKPKLDNA